MPGQNPLNGDRVSTVEQKPILIIGANKLQNELLATSLEKAAAARCSVFDDCAALEHESPVGNEKHIVLFDCMGKSLDECMQDCAPLVEKNHAGRFLCLFNLKKDTVLEESLLPEGVRGFFYSGESFQNLVKGIVAVQKGGFWVPRRIMTDLIEKSNNVRNKAGEDVLTRREIEILAEIVEGATNEQIADRLCLSKHTVKTHIYNIFKKINVQSRYQAALWAAKHL
jgi:DNA-binding NarL/FixJ family response regulator